MAAKSNTPANATYSKLYYAISEVAQITGVKAHVLRYWESEFPSLKPRKTRTGSRRYRPADIDEVQVIKELLYKQGFKIAGARKMLRQKKKKPETRSAAPPQMALKFSGMDDAQKLEFLKTELSEVLGLIKELEGSMKTTGDKPTAKTMKGKA